MDQCCYSHTIELGGVPLTVRVEYRESGDYFARYEVDNAAPAAVLSASEEDWRYMQRSGFARCAHTEVGILTATASDALLPYDRMILHAAAFSFRGRAWLIAAAPGVGKSTQLRYLRELYPGEFSVICGDRPVLQRRDDGSFLVYPSPWNGKENWHGAPAAPLAGILCLRRGETTSITVMKNRDAVIPVFASLISAHETEETIRRLSALEDALLRAVPVYEYVNGGVPDSTRYFYHFLTEGETPHGI